MKKVYILILTLILFITCSCSKKIVYGKTNAIISYNDLTIEYGDEVYLNDLVNINNGHVDSNFLIEYNDLGEKIIEFTYIDNNKKHGKTSFKINVVDTTNPIINNSKNYYTTLGKDINILKKIFCGDNYDRSLTCTIEGEYDINKYGKYPLNIIARDKNGNTAVSRTNLNVVKKIEKEINNSKTLVQDIIKKHKNDNTLIGIDVSSWQGEIDWKKVHDSKVEFAIIRVGWGYNDNHEFVMDKYFLKNFKEAKENNIKIGLYFYSYAITEKEAKEHANWIVKTLNGEKLDLPIAFDFENWSNFDDENLNFYDINKVAKAYFEEIEKNNYKAMKYGSKYYLNNIWKLKKYPTWLAHYTDKTNYDKDYFMWQLCNNGVVDGLNSYVDLDILYLDKLK